jgi:cellulose synthase (UDP-forming)
VTRAAFALLLLALAGCPSVPNEPPPPVEKVEIPVAPPHARGAKAGGTDAAPKPDGVGAVAEPEPAVPVPPPAGSAPDGATPAPAAPPPAPPDAGMAL